MTKGVHMVRKLSLLLLLFGVLAAGRVLALGLGDIDLKSNLNQPLNAEIELLTTDQSEIKDLKVSLASPEEFRRTGIDYHLNLKDIKFNVIQKSNGRSYIRISSTVSFREPYLNLLVEVSWNRGRIMREYALLIDPPVVTPTQSTQYAVREAPPSETPKSAKEPEVEPEDEKKSGSTDSGPPLLREEPKAKSKEPPVEQAKEPAVDPAVEQPKETLADKGSFATEAEKFPRVPITADDSSSAEVDLSRVDTTRKEGKYKTKRGDTMMDIARKLRPHGSLSLHQTMMAIKKANPNAFINGNVHLVKANQTLLVPDRAAIAAISRTDAASLYTSDTELFKQRRAPVTIAKTDSEVKIGYKGTLELLPPGKKSLGDLGTSKSAGKEEGPGVDVIAKDQTDKKDVVEKAEKVADKTPELAPDKPKETTAATKLDQKEISDVNKTQKDRLINIPSADLASMQHNINKRQYCRENEFDGNCFKVLGFDPVDIRLLQSANKEVKQPFKDANQLDFVAKVQKQFAVWLEYLKDRPLIAAMIGGGTLFFLVVLFLIVRQRRRSKGEFEESILEFEEELHKKDDKPAVTGRDASSKMTASTSSRHSASASTSDDGLMAGEQSVQPAQSSYLSDFAVSNINNGEAAGDSDPLTEADVFYAYGKYEAAEMLIKEAIQAQPNRLELHCKLLDIYHGAKNVTGFEQEATVLYKFLGGRRDPMWDKVVEMGYELNPENTLFGGVAVVPRAPVATTASNSESANTKEDFDFNFDFSLPEDSKKIADLDSELAALETSLSLAKPPLSKKNENVVSFNPSHGDDFMSSDSLDPYDEGGVVSDVDEVGTKLDLAKAYIDMGDPEGARSILGEVMEEGSDVQKGEATELMRQMAS